MQTVAADEREERRQERAALRARAFRDHPGELAELEAEKAEAEEARHDEADLRPQHVAHAGAIIARPQAKLDSRRNAVSTATVVQVEEFERPRAARGRMRQHRVGGIEAREHHEVGEQEHPEAIGRDDALRRRSAVSRSRGSRSEAAADRLVSSDDPAPARMPGSRPATRSSRASRLTRVDPGDLVGRHLVFVMVAPGEDDEGGEGAGDADRSQPPDVPDQREAGDDGEEGDDEAGRAVDAASRSLRSAATASARPCAIARCLMPQ